MNHVSAIIVTNNNDRAQSVVNKLNEQTRRPEDIIVISSDRFSRTMEGCNYSYRDCNVGEARNVGLFKITTATTHILWIDDDVLIPVNLLEDLLKINADITTPTIEGAGDKHWKKEQHHLSTLQQHNNLYTPMTCYLVRREFTFSFPSYHAAEDVYHNILAIRGGAIYKQTSRIIHIQGFARRHFKNRIKRRWNHLYMGIKVLSENKAFDMRPRIKKIPEPLAVIAYLTYKIRYFKWTFMICLLEGRYMKDPP